MKPTIIAKNKEHLQLLIKEEIKLHGYDCDLNHIDVTQVKDLSNLFKNSSFNGDISRWDVSKVTNMQNLFYRSKFNGNISDWNVSKVQNFSRMFVSTPFNRDISKWDVSSAKDMIVLFTGSQFKGDLTEWKPVNLRRSDYVFVNCSAPIPYWAGYENNDAIQTVIDNYQLNKDLNNELLVNPDLSKRTKI